ncbi:MAG: Bax inhibitor-1/YccA family protein [Sphingopyxis sp.]
MANWSDPRGPGTANPMGGLATPAAVDVGLRAHMLKVYNYMASGVLLSGIVAMLFAQGGASSLGAQYVLGGGATSWIIRLAPLAFILVLSFGIHRLSTVAAQALFWAFAAVMGMSLSAWLLVYSSESVATAFFSTSAAFVGLSLFGYTTKRNLSGFGTFLLMGLVGLIVAMLLNAFIFQSGAMGLAISAIGVLIFAGLTAYDTQMIKNQYYEVMGTDFAGKAVIMGALNLYLDFVNMFMMLLNLFGSRE